MSSALAEAGAQYIEDEVGAHNILNKLRVELNKKTAYPLTLSPQVFYLGASAPQNILTRFHDKQDISDVFNSISHSESESLGGGGRKETRKKYGSTISLIWGEAVDGMRILWRPYSQSYFWAEPPKIMLGQGVVSTT